MRRRALVIALAAAMVGGAAYLDAASPPVPRAQAALAPAPAPAVLACPLAFVPGGRAYLHLANAGRRAAPVKITLAPARGKRATIDVVVRAGSARSVRLHGRVERAAGAIVEAGGPDIVATHSLYVPRRDVGRKLFRIAGSAGAGAAPCTRPGDARQLVPGARTYHAESTLALLNPGSSPADVDVSLLSDGRSLFPTRLRGVVVPPRATVTFRLEDYAFDARDVTPVVTAASSRVAAEVMVRTERGVTLAAGGPASTSLGAIAARGGEGAIAGVVSIGDDDPELDSRLLSREGQGKAPRIPTSLEPGRARRAPIPDDGPLAYSFTVPFGSPVVAHTSWRVVRPRGGDVSLVEGVAPATRLVAVAGGLGERFVMRVIVAATGDAPVAVHVRRLGAGADRTISIPAGRVVSLPLGGEPGTYAVELSADVPFTAGVVAVGVDRAVRAFAMPAVALPSPPDTAVTLDVRAGSPR